VGPSARPADGRCSHGTQVFDAAVPIATINKEQLMCNVARTLASEEGRVYTGCDINTTEQDMDFLDNISP
jgi:hypothetical protein